MKINIASNELIHFIGIGGIGMSGLAQIMTNMGFQIQGSDLNDNKNIDRLVKSGIKTFIGHNKKNIKKATMVVISSAIKKNNKELIESKKKKLPGSSEAQELAIRQRYKQGDKNWVEQKLEQVIQDPLDDGILYFAEDFLQRKYNKQQR